MMAGEKYKKQKVIKAAEVAVTPVDNRHSRLSSIKTKTKFQEECHCQFEGKLWQINELVQKFFTKDCRERCKPFLESMIKEYFNFSHFLCFDNNVTEDALYPILFIFVSGFLRLSTSPDEYKIEAVTKYEVGELENFEEVAYENAAKDDSGDVESDAMVKLKGYVEIIVHRGEKRILVIEAKKELSGNKLATNVEGFWQLCAEMKVCAYLNASSDKTEGKNIKESIPVYGVLTCLDTWFLLKLENDEFYYSQGLQFNQFKPEEECGTGFESIVWFLLHALQLEGTVHEHEDRLKSFHGRLS